MCVVGFFAITLLENLSTILVALFSALAAWFGTFYTYRIKSKQLQKSDFQALIDANESYRQEVRLDLSNAKQELNACRLMIENLNNKVVILENELSKLTKNKSELQIKLDIAEQRFVKLANTVPFCVFRADRNGNVFFVNHYLCEKTGFAAEEICNGKWKNLIYESDREVFTDKWNQALNDHTHFEHEYRINARKNRQNMILSFYTKMIREEDSDGRLIGYIGFSMILGEDFGEKV